MKRKLCPGCSGTNFSRWIAGKEKCLSCSAVWSPHELIVQEDTPKVRRAPRKVSALQEKANAKAIGGRTVIASGATKWDKADVKAADVRMECKYTEAASYSLKRADLEKLVTQAQSGEIPLLAVQFKDPYPVEWYAVPKEWFLQLLDAWRREQG